MQLNVFDVLSCFCDRVNTVATLAKAHLSLFARRSSTETVCSTTPQNCQCSTLSYLILIGCAIKNSFKLIFRPLHSHFTSLEDHLWLTLL